MKKLKTTNGFRAIKALQTAVKHEGISHVDDGPNLLATGSGRVVLHAAPLWIFHPGYESLSVGSTAELQLAMRHLRLKTRREHDQID